MAEVEAGAETCCQGQSWCAVTCTTDVLSRKWHTVIVHRLLAEGPLGFTELKDEIEGISDKVLSESLDDLVDHAIVDRTTLQETPRRVEYRLTRAGRDLRPVIEAMEAWGREHLEPEGRAHVGLGDGLVDG